MLIDIVLIAIVTLFIIIGYKAGLVKTVFKLFSGILSLILAMEFYKPFARFMLKTNMFYSINLKIQTNILKILPDVTINTKEDVGSLILDKTYIPNPMKESIIDSLPENVNLINNSKIAEVIGTRISTLVVELLSVILIFLIVRFLIWVARKILEGIIKLPILKQINKAGGVVLGAVQGIFIVYVLLSIVVVLNNATILGCIDHSIITKYLYYNNLFIDLFF